MRIARCCIFGILVGGTSLPARAQFSTSPTVVAIYVGVPTAGVLACDVGLAATLSRKGWSPRSLAIGGLILTAVDSLTAALLLQAGLNGGYTAQSVITASTLALDVVSAILVVIGLAHPPSDPLEPWADRAAQRPRIRVTPYAATTSGRSSAGVALVGRW